MRDVRVLSALTLTVSTDLYLAIYELGNDIFNSKVFINKFFSFKICGSSHFVAFKDI